MIIQDRTKAFPDKVNFVDENGVILGYDMLQCCCETAGWFLSDQPDESSREPGGESIAVSGWRFDPTYFVDIPVDDMDDGGHVVFRLVSNDKEKFLHLFNCHNGYYSHGFEFVCGETVLQKGSL